MKNRVYLIGAFHEMVELLEDLGVEIIGLIDKSSPDCQVCSRYPYLGDDQWLLEKGPESKSKIILTPDAPDVREKIFAEYAKHGFEFGAILGGNISNSAVVGEGTVIQKSAYISSCVRLGKAVKINVGARIMHDSSIGNFSTVAPDAVVLGKVVIGKNCYIGANSTILPGITVGDRSVVGAGAVVSRNVAKNTTVKGVPAR